MSDNYNTKPTPKEEAQYQMWLLQITHQKGVGFKVSEADRDYDMRGYWKDIASKGSSNTDQKSNGAIHFVDTYKKPNHPTFSVESKYSNNDHPGGVWDDSGNFHPSEWNITNARGVDNLKTYFKTNEPDSKLILSPSEVIYPYKANGAVL